METLERIDRGISALGMGDTERQLIEMKAQAILSGRTIFIKEADDHEAHLNVYRKIAGSDAFEQAASNAQLMLLAQISQHLIAMNNGEPVYISQRRGDN